MIAVFDSGIWVSAMEFGGTPLEAVIRAVAQDQFAVCSQIEEDYGWLVAPREAMLGCSPSP